MRILILSGLTVTLTISLLASTTNADLTTGAGFNVINDSLGTQTSIITIENCLFPIQSVEVTLVGLSHTRAGDLTFTLESPDGTVIDLFDQIQSGAATADFAGNYRFADGGDDIWSFGFDSFIPPGTYFASDSVGESISITDAFQNQDPNGNWILSVTDHSPGEDGSLELWSLNKETVPEPSSIGLLLAGLTCCAFRRRRSKGNDSLAAGLVSLRAASCSEDLRLIY